MISNSDFEKAWFLYIKSFFKRSGFKPRSSEYNLMLASVLSSRDVGLQGENARILWMVFR